MNSESASLLLNFWLTLAHMLGPSSQTLHSMPPKPVDAQLRQIPPANTALYYEWSGRGSSKSSQGIEGFLADPENKPFLDKLGKATDGLFELATKRSQREADQTIDRLMLLLVKVLLTQPGMAYASIDAKEMAKLRGASPNQTFQHLNLVVVAKTGPYRDDVEKTLIKLLQEQQPDPTLKRLHRYAVAFDRGIECYLHFEDDYLVYTMGRKAFDHVLGQMKGTDVKKGMVSSKTYQEVMKPLQGPRVATLAFCDLAGLRTFFDAVSDRGTKEAVQAMDFMGWREVSALASATGVKDNGQGWIKQHLLISGKRKGLLSLFDGPALKAHDFRHIPAESLAVVGVSVDLPGVYRSINQAVNALAKENANIKTMYDGAIRMAQFMVQLSIEDDLLKAFDGKMVLHLLPGGPGLPADPVLTLGVADQAKAQKVLTNLHRFLNTYLKNLKRNTGRGGRLQTTSYRGQTVYYWFDDATTFALSPTVCLHKNKLLIALHPQPVKSLLRAIPAPGASMADRFEKELGQGSADPVVVGLFRPRAVGKTLYPMVPYLPLNDETLEQAQQANPNRLDEFDLPSSQALVPYLPKSSSLCLERTKTGLVSHDFGPVPWATMFPVSMMHLVVHQHLYQRFLLHRYRMEEYPDVIRRGQQGDEGSVKPAPKPFDKPDSQTKKSR